MWRQRGFAFCGLISSGLIIPSLAFAGGGNPPDPLTMIGRLHPLVVHFPIALIVLAGGLELFRRKAGTRMPVQAIPLLLALGAVGAIAAAGAGWQLASGGGFDETLLWRHRWLGVGAATSAMFAAISAYGLSRSGDGRITWVYRGFLYISVGCIALGGHYGATLTHGDPFRDMPASAASHEHGDASDKKDADVPSQTGEHGDVTEGDHHGMNNENKTPNFITRIKPIFVANCIKCHGAKKQKGMLRFDKRKYIFRGDPADWVMQPRNAAESRLMKLILAPEDEQEKMPPKGKRLSAEDIEAIRQWIDSGMAWPDED